jgi:hypothetical protein
MINDLRAPGVLVKVAACCRILELGLDKSFLKF